MVLLLIQTNRWKTWVFSNLKLEDKYDFELEKLALEDVEIPKKLIMKIISVAVPQKYDLRCYISIGEKDDSFFQTNKTKEIKGVKEAHFNELLVFEMPTKACKITIEIKDKTKDLFLGQVIIPIQEISVLKPKRFRLQPHEKHKDLKIAGEIDLKFFLDNVYQIHQDDIFGVSLISVMEREHEDGIIPKGMKKVIDYLEKTSLDIKGIFRISATVKDVEILQYRLDNGDVITFDETDESMIHAASNVLKLYFRDLPNPLLTFELYDSFLKLDPKEDPKTLNPTIKGLITKLPEEHKNMFEELFGYLKKVIAKKGC